MDTVTKIFSNNLDVVYFFYGSAVTLMGVSIFLQQRRGSVYELARVLWLFGAGGLAHGVHEYIDMWGMIKGEMEILEITGTIFLLASYLLIFEFGRQLSRISTRAYPVWMRSIISKNIWWLPYVMLGPILLISWQSPEFLTTFIIMSKYFICIPAYTISGLGLLAYCRINQDMIQGMQITPYFRAAAVSIIGYGLLSGIVVSKADFFPANWINTEIFLATVGLPVQIFRALMAVLTTWSVYGILKIFNFEAASRLEQEIIERKHIEEQLRYYGERLEEAVKKRASELIKVNEQLINEINERKKIAAEREHLLEEQVQAAKEWQDTFDATEDIICLISSDFHLLKMNKAGYKSLGKKPEEIIGQTSFELVEGLSHPFSGCPCMKALKSGRAESIEISERDRYYIISAAPIIDDNGQINAFVHTVTDMTERKRAETELQASLAALHQALDSTIEVVALTVEARDPYTAGHQKRVADLASAIAGLMGLSHDQVEGIRMAGIIHDIGKISVPGEILSKPGFITQAEMALIREHSQIGADILKTINFPWPLNEIILQHHERLDGSGYPAGLKDEEILMEARILAVADVVEAMASHRPYRAALGIDAALKEITKHRGVLYDQDVVDACVRLFKEYGYDLNNNKYPSATDILRESELTPV